MTKATIEHANVTVSDVDRSAKMLCDLFDWHIRWKGKAASGGITVHVGNDTHYIAVYSKGATGKQADSFYTIGALNHIGIVVEDLDAMETRVIELGYTPINHADYEPGRRFYFVDHDGIEFELVSYD